MRSSSPFTRKIDWPAPVRPASGSLPRSARSTRARSASSFRRPGESVASGSSVASCSAVARPASFRDGAPAIGLELEHLVVLEHARPERSGARLDLFHDQLDLAGLEMRDPDVGAALELGELVGEHGRAKV